jgi:glycosyltransferase involved in cell wall biosynthesis
MKSRGRRAQPTFSVVIPTYQSADTIADAVRSVLGQTRPAHEIIVVDDGSTDDLDGALEPLLEQITLIRKANGGGASALNAGARQATGDFLAILDSDDVYLPGRLSALAQLAAAQPGLDLLTTDAYFVVDHERVGRFNVANPFPVDGQRETILERCFIFAPAIRRSRLLEIRGFDCSNRRRAAHGVQDSRRESQREQSVKPAGAGCRARQGHAQSRAALGGTPSRRALSRPQSPTRAAH